MGRKTQTETLAEGVELTVVEHPVDEQYDLAARLRDLGGKTPPIAMVREMLKYSRVVTTDAEGKKRKFELGQKADFAGAFDGNLQLLLKAVNFMQVVNFPMPAQVDSGSGESGAGAGDASSSST